ncbi:MAG: transglycosylase family protein [Solirubrobacteraceae bacterium]|nr:transglycosylase family protein [Solirubrobacteraceae bacterium]
MIAQPPHTTRTAARSRLLAPCLLAVLALLFLSNAPAAHATGGGVAIDTTSTSATASKSVNTSRSVGKVQVRRAQTLLRITATGKHDAATRRVVKRFQTLRGLQPLGIIDLTTYVQIRDAFALLQTGGLAIDATGAGTAGATASAIPSYPANLAAITPQERDLLDKIAQCESKGDPRAISANGKFRGKYQFDVSTWKAVGGSGDPAAATEDEQDQRAAILLRQRGTAPWPVCGL